MNMVDTKNSQFGWEIDLIQQRISLVLLKLKSVFHTHQNGKFPFFGEINVFSQKNWCANLVKIPHNHFSFRNQLGKRDTLVQCSSVWWEYYKFVWHQICEIYFHSIGSQQTLKKKLNFSNWINLRSSSDWMMVF